MIKISLRGASLAACCALAFAVTSSAQEFQKSYRIGSGGSISIHNVSGDIVVSGYDGDAVIVSGFKEGRDRDQVEVEDLSGPNRVELRVRYPSPCNCDASIRFSVRVPRGAEHNLDQLSTASGNIEVSGIRGRVRLRTASGDVLVKDIAGPTEAATASGEMRVRDVAGAVSAHSSSGDVDVEIARPEETGDMEFSSASGDVHVKLPAQLDADVELASTSGSVKTDFPLETQKRRHGAGSIARGRLGNGSRVLRVSSASGDVTLSKL